MRSPMRSEQDGARGPIDEGEPRLAIYMFVVKEQAPFVVRARMFAPHTDNISEDPATGKRAAPWARMPLTMTDQTGTVSAFLIQQGVEMAGRATFTSRLHARKWRARDPHRRTMRIVGEGAMFLERPLFRRPRALISINSASTPLNPTRLRGGLREPTRACSYAFDPVGPFAIFSVDS